MPSGDYSPDVRLTPKHMVRSRRWKEGYGRTTIRVSLNASRGSCQPLQVASPNLLPPTFATRIDEMPHLDRLRFKATHVFLKVAVSSRQSLVLSQVLRPRFDDERFDVVRRMLSIAIDAPPEGSVPSSHPCKFVESLQELVRLPQLNLIFHCNQYRSLTGVYVSNQHRLAPVIPSPKIHRRIRQARNQNQYWTNAGANSRRNQRKVCTLSARDISPESAAGCPRSMYTSMNTAIARARTQSGAKFCITVVIKR